MSLLLELGYDECLELLRSRVAGRVAVNAPDGPHILPVNYAVLDETILMRTTPYSVLGTYGRNTMVAFEVDHLDEEQRRGWSVAARGRCHSVEDPSEIRRLMHQAPPQPWAAGQRTLLLQLQWRELTGRTLLSRPDDLLGLGPQRDRTEP